MTSQAALDEKDIGQFLVSDSSSEASSDSQQSLHYEVHPKTKRFVKRGSAKQKVKDEARSLSERKVTENKIIKSDTKEKTQQDSKRHKGRPRKRKADNNVSGGKPSKILCNSPVSKLSSVSNSKSYSSNGCFETVLQEKMSSPRRKSNTVDSSLKNSASNSPAQLHSKQVSESPTKVAAVKQLFPDSNQIITRTPRISLRRCSSPQKDSWKCNVIMTASPKKDNANNLSSKTKTVVNHDDKRNKTPQKSKAVATLDSLETELVRRGSVSKFGCTDSDIPTNLRSPQKMIGNSPLKSHDNQLKRLNEQSPTKTVQIKSDISSPSPLKETLKTNLSLLLNKDDKNVDKKSPKKILTRIKTAEKEEKKENDSNVSESIYSTPNKRENKVISKDKQTPLSCSKYNHLPDTPKASPLSIKKVTVTTPISKKSSGRGVLSASMAKREEETSSKTDDALTITRKQLHISTIPKSLPCRDVEFSQIKSFLLRKIAHSAGGCMYISGVPGTGKTATVHAVIRSLQEEVAEGELPEFEFVEVNGLRLTEPRQAYVRIYQSLTNQKLTPDQAQQLLNKRFSGTCKKTTIILVDELDYLCNRRQDVVYNILDWPTKRASGLVVLTISNTIDLPERTLKGRVTSRMGLTRLMFQPYSHHQLREIVQDRLYGSDTFHPDAVQLVARKVAAVSGDARRALDICRRTTELVKGEEQVTVAHIEQALTQIFSGPRVLVIQSLSQLGQIVLRSLRDVNQRTGVDECTVNQVYRHLEQLCVLEGCVLPPVGAILQACVALVGLGLIVAEKGRMDITRKMSLNVSSDDIHYALDKINR